MILNQRLGLDISLLDRSKYNSIMNTPTWVHNPLRISYDEKTADVTSPVGPEVDRY
jgi:hypothetical protein